MATSSGKFHTFEKWKEKAKVLHTKYKYGDRAHFEVYEDASAAQGVKIRCLVCSVVNKDYTKFTYDVGGGGKEAFNLTLSGFNGHLKRRNHINNIGAPLWQVRVVFMLVYLIVSTVFFLSAFVHPINMLYMHVAGTCPSMWMQGDMSRWCERWGTSQ